MDIHAERDKKDFSQVLHVFARAMLTRNLPRFVLKIVSVIRVFEIVVALSGV